MKNAPLAKVVRLSESRIGQRHEEIATPKAFSKPIHSPEELPDRSIPHHSLRGLHTEAELAEFVATNHQEHV
jgi:hypothetical protein